MENSNFVVGEIKNEDINKIVDSMRTGTSKATFAAMPPDAAIDKLVAYLKTFANNGN